MSYIMFNNNIFCSVKAILQMNPPSAARALMNDLTKPLKHELRYIKKVHGGSWVGCILLIHMHIVSVN
jgi:hypothetical protein